jgi:hypothetical protein
MQKWEYCIVAVNQTGLSSTISIYSPEGTNIVRGGLLPDITATLNSLGQQTWEVVGFGYYSADETGNKNMMWTLKRPIE